jgi:hypothetical protein
MFNQLAWATLMVSVASATALSQPEMIEFRGAGTCNASAAVALDERRVIVGDDEQPWLATFDVTTHALLETTSIPFLLGDGEADIEGATILRGQVIWITSHGRDGKGRVRESRRMLFGSHQVAADGSVTKHIVGPFRDLLSALTANPGDNPVFARLRASVGSMTPNSSLAPKVDGINIEGLTTSEGMVPRPEAPALLIGLRNPAAEDGRAILLELRNASDLMSGLSVKADLGRTILLNLGGRRIRDIAWSPYSGTYLIIGGPAGEDTNPFPDGHPSFVVFKWNGREDAAPVATDEPGKPDSLDGFRPEAIVPLPTREAGKLVPSDRVLLLSDDGKRDINGTPCEKLSVAEQFFRGMIRRVQ